MSRTRTIVDEPTLNNNSKHKCTHALGSSTVRNIIHDIIYIFTDFYSKGVTTLFLQTFSTVKTHLKHLYKLCLAAFSSVTAGRKMLKYFHPRRAADEIWINWPFTTVAAKRGKNRGWKRRYYIVDNSDVSKNLTKLRSTKIVEIQLRVRAR